MDTPFMDFMAKAVVDVDKDLSGRISGICKSYKALYSDMASRIRSYYAEYVDSGSKEGIMRWGMGSGEYKSLENDLEMIYRDGSEQIEEAVFAILLVVAASAYYRMFYAYSWLDPRDSVVPVPDEMLDLSVEGGSSEWDMYLSSGYSSTFGDPSYWSPKREELSRIMAFNRDKEVKDIISSVASSLSVGAGIRSTLRGVRRLVSMTTRNVLPDGRSVTKVHGAAASATRVLRTEGNRLINAGIVAAAMGFYGAENETVMKRWTAILDSRTRTQSVSMNGQTVPLNGYFVYPNGAKSMYPGQSGYPQYDVNDRCTSVTVIPSDDGQDSGTDPYTGDFGRFSWSHFDDWRSSMGISETADGLYYMG